MKLEFLTPLFRTAEEYFPRACTYTSKGNIWLGAIAYEEEEEEDLFVFNDYRGTQGACG